MSKKFYQTNQYIRADKVRLIDEKGHQIGIFSLKEALDLAIKAGQDLVMIADKAKPPVCKIINFKKFLYQVEKKSLEEKRKSKKTAIKEVRLTPFIAENDFNTRMKRAQDFLKKGYKVRLGVFFRGRELTKKSFGYTLLEKAKEKLNMIAAPDGEIKMAGNRLELMFNASQNSKNEENKTKNQKIN